MAVTMTKAKVATKPRKTTAKAKAAPREMKVVSHEEIEKLAHRFWAERGHQFGHPELDWFRAEQELRARAS